jgi:ribokinase
MTLGLEGEGVDTRQVKVCEGRSGTAFVMVDPAGLRSILIDPGVNDGVCIQDLDLDFLKGFDLVHMTSFVCRSGDLSFRTQLELAGTNEVTISLDPGQLYAERGLDGLRPLIENSSILLPNQGELGLMTGLGPRQGAKKLLQLGSEIVAVKMGLQGSFVTDGHLEATVPAYGLEGLDTTGAGDAYNAGFLFGVLNGLGLIESAELGSKVAWFCVQKPGARTGLPSRKELDSLDAGT